MSGSCKWWCLGVSSAVLIVPSIILGLAFSPYRFHPVVDSAILAAFDISTPPPKSTNALRYNLSVDLSFRNSHRHLSFRHLDVAATAFYGDFMLGFPDRTFPTPFRQGPKNTTVRYYQLACLLRITHPQLRNELNKISTGISGSVPEQGGRVPERGGGGGEGAGGRHAACEGETVDEAQDHGVGHQTARTPLQLRLLVMVPAAPARRVRCWHPVLARQEMTIRPSYSFHIVKRFKTVAIRLNKEGKYKHHFVLVILA